MSDNQADILYSLLLEGRSVKDSMQLIKNGKEDPFSHLFKMPDKIMPLIVPIPGKLNKIPRPECIEAHLPKDRKPTRDEVKAAWGACIA